MDHPGVASRSPDGLLGDKHKVWCEKCFSARVAAEVARDEGEVTAGLRASIRDQQTIQSTCAHLIIFHAFCLQMIFLIYSVGSKSKGSRSRLASLRYENAHKSLEGLQSSTTSNKTDG